MCVKYISLNIIFKKICLFLNFTIVWNEFLSDVESGNFMILFLTTAFNNTFYLSGLKEF